ncbi:MAG: GyrI-like domain-containing protein [Candidatus Heimdallarchaeota archaeon]
MAKIDLKKELKGIYSNISSSKFSIVDVPPLNFLMIDGQGDPNTSADYQAAMEALYPISYTLKFMMKDKGNDYVVMPLEGLWWVPNMEGFSEENKDAWYWTSMIMQPDFITPALFDQAVAEVKKKKAPAALDKVRFEVYEEGKSVQILYFGPYSDEGPTIANLHKFIEKQGYSRRGKHHEIYLSDPRRTKPDRLKTIIRQPVS